MSDHSKAALRRHYQQMRRELPLHQAHGMLIKMVHRLADMTWPKGQWLMSYKASAARHEISMPYLEDALTEYTSGFQFCYPRTRIADLSMEAIADDAHVTWAPSAFGILEPTDGNVVPPEEISLILVPLLCFDMRGYRVGYGKGFYDRYLKRCSPDAVTIGFSWFGPVKAIEDIDANDVPLKYCITPDQLYVF